MKASNESITGSLYIPMRTMVSFAAAHAPWWMSGIVRWLEPENETLRAQFLRQKHAFPGSRPTLERPFAVLSSPARPSFLLRPRAASLQRKYC